MVDMIIILTNKNKKDSTTYYSIYSLYNHYWYEMTAKSVAAKNTLGQENICFCMKWVMGWLYIYILYIYIYIIYIYIYIYIYALPG